MKKPLAGKRFFEAMGRRAASQEMPFIHDRLAKQAWPVWARSAWARGWIMQPSPRESTERIVCSFEQQAQREGKTLQQTVANFLKEFHD